MFDALVMQAPGRFCPEVRGWAALRLAPLVPAALRRELETRADRQPPGADFHHESLSAVSTPGAVAWAREIATRAAALGVAAGPACLARLWVARLLRPRGNLQACWPSVVDRVWNVVGRMLEKTGVAARGPNREELRHEVAAPLALVLLKSLAAGRRDFRLLGIGGLARPDGPPFGWAPGIDALGLVIGYLVAGQVPGRFRSHALLASPLARVACAAGLVAPVWVTRWRCARCRAWADGDSGWCRQCGGPLVLCRSRQLVAVALLVRGTFSRGDPAPPAARPGWSPDGGRLAVEERVEAHSARRRCVLRAGLLWQKVVRGRRCNVAAIVVLGVLAGVQPLVAVADRRPAPQRWMERFVEVLTEGRLDRESIARQANAAMPAVAGRLGSPLPPPIQAAYVGVLAARFRRAVLYAAGPAIK